MIVILQFVQLIFYLPDLLDRQNNSFIYLSAFRSVTDNA